MLTLIIVGVVAIIIMIVIGIVSSVDRILKETPYNYVNGLFNW